MFDLFSPQSSFSTALLLTTLSMFHFVILLHGFVDVHPIKLLKEAFHTAGSFSNW